MSIIRYSCRFIQEMMSVLSSAVALPSLFPDAYMRHQRAISRSLDAAMFVFRIVR